MKFLSEAVAFHKHCEEKEPPEEEEVISYSSEEKLSDAKEQLQQLLGEPMGLLGLDSFKDRYTSHLYIFDLRYKDALDIFITFLCLLITNSLHCGLYHL